MASVNSAAMNIRVQIQSNCACTHMLTTHTHTHISDCDLTPLREDEEKLEWPKKTEAKANWQSGDVRSQSKQFGGIMKRNFSF